MLTRCPNCGASMSLDALIGHDELRALLAEVICLLPAPSGGQRNTRSDGAWGQTFGRAVLRYLGLFRPVQRELRPERAARLLRELLADVQRGAITRRGREWPAGPDLWQAALDSVLDAAAKGSLQPPLADHGYLYEVLMRLADKQEAAQEQRREQDLRHAPRAGAVRIHGQPQAVSAAQALQRDPALQKLDSDARNAAPMPAHVRQRIQQMLNTQPPKAKEPQP